MFARVLCSVLSLLIAAQVYADSLPSNDMGHYASVDINGAAATVHPLATRAAMDALDNGGTAIDAAIAAAVTLGVVDGHNSGIGGGNFAVVRWADGQIEALDGREQAPLAARHDMFVRKGKGDIQLSTTGPLAVGIPGSVAVYQYMHNRGGKLAWQDLILPAANLAQDGFVLSASTAGRIVRTAKKIRRFPATSKIFLDADQQPLAAGVLLKQQDLANSYRLLAKQGGEYFYRGDFAKRVAAWMADNGGIITADDFANYQMRIRQPTVSEYRGYQIVGFPPPSSGGVHVAQILNILENFDLRSLDEVTRYHILAEAMQLAFADRAYFLGDPDFVPVPRGLMDKRYGQQLAAKINPKKSAAKVEHGTPPNADIDLFGKHTTHISVADKLGNWVAITTTVNTSFGSKVIVPGTGVVLNNQMDDFSTQPGIPNAFGLVGNQANSVQPSKRPLSSMSPTLVLKKGEPVMSLGAAGGPTIITQVVQTLVNVIDLDMDAEKALAAQRIHHQWLPEVLFVENAMPETLQAALKARGHSLHSRGFAGATQLILRNSKGEMTAASEPRVIAQNKKAKQQARLKVIQ